MENDFATGYALGQDSGSRNNGGFGGWGDGAWIWVILIFAIFGGGWGFGGGFGGMGGASGALTRGELCQDFNFQNLDRSVMAIQQGLCDGFYTQAQLVNGIERTVADGFNGTNIAMLNGFNQSNVTALQNANALQRQIADCCCENRAAIAQVRYDMATQDCATRTLIQNTTRDVIDSQNANTRAILDFLTQDKIATLTAENQGLKLAASQAAQNNYLVSQLRPAPVPSYQVPAPYPYCQPHNAGCNTCYGNYAA